MPDKLYKIRSLLHIRVPHDRGERGSVFWARLEATMTRATSETLAARNTRRNNKKGRKQANALTTIVGIGASAGGLDASERLLSCVRDDLGMAYILVQHLDPTHASHLTEILSRATRMPVSEVKEGMRVQADHVY